MTNKTPTREEASAPTKEQALEALANISEYKPYEIRSNARKVLRRFIESASSAAPAALTIPSESQMALIRRHRQACFAFATCKPEQHSAAAEEMMSATEALEQALTALSPSPATEREVERDAQRYRWLRDKAMETVGVTPFAAVGADDGDCEAVCGEELDAAIDSAIRASTMTKDGAQSRALTDEELADCGLLSELGEGSDGVKGGGDG